MTRKGIRAYHHRQYTVPLNCVWVCGGAHASRNYVALRGSGAGGTVTSRVRGSGDRDPESRVYSAVVKPNSHTLIILSYQALTADTR